MNIKTRAKFFRGLFFSFVFLGTSLVGHLLLNEDLNYRAGIIGVVAAAFSILLTPKMKTIKSQSGQWIQVTSIFLEVLNS